jgi:hypothetical protein
MTIGRGADVANVGTVEACRRFAAEIWRAERPHEHLGVHALNTEVTVRERLQKIAMELDAMPVVADGVQRTLLTIDWLGDDPLSILERTEQMLMIDWPYGWVSVDDMLAHASPATMVLVRLLLVQSIAGRLGRWAVRTGEIPDARTARTLYKDLGEAHWSQYRALMNASAELIEAGRHRDAAISLLDADRLVRTPAGLLKAAVQLGKAGDFISALWAIRAALLEQRASFETLDARDNALEIELRLRAIIEGRAAVPLALDEVELLGEGEGEGEGASESEDRTEAEEHAPTQPGFATPKPTAVLMMPAHMRSRSPRRAATIQDRGRDDDGVPTLVEAAPGDEATEIPPGDEATEVPPERPIRLSQTTEPIPVSVAHVVPTNVVAPAAVRPLAHRTPTLPPSSAHRSLLAAEKRAASDPHTKRTAEMNVANLVNHMFAQDLVALGALDEHSDEWSPITVDEADVVELTPESPTESASAALLPLASAAYEETERVRNRNMPR